MASRGDMASDVVPQHVQSMKEHGATDCRMDMVQKPTPTVERTGDSGWVECGMDTVCDRVFLMAWRQSFVDRCVHR